MTIEQQQFSNGVRKTEEKMQSTVENIKNQGHETLDKFANKLSETVKGAEKKLKDTAESARDYTAETSDKLANYVRNNPITALACAAGLGALLAMLMRS